MDPNVLPPYIIHAFTKKDKVIPSIHDRNDYLIKSLVKQGIVGNYVYVSSKNGSGIDDLCTAIFDSDIK